MSKYEKRDICSTCRFSEKNNECTKEIQPNLNNGTCRSYSGPDEDCYPESSRYNWR